MEDKSGPPLFFIDCVDDMCYEFSFGCVAQVSHQYANLTLAA